MFKLFSKKEGTRPIAPQPLVAVMEPLVTTSIDVRKPVKKTGNSLVEEIHQAFYTEVDRLLSEAQVSHSLETTQQDLINKCRKLEALGFHQSKEVLSAKAEIARLAALEVSNKEKEKLIKAINYFKEKYPFYKFITEDSVKKICANYGLVYSDVKNYIGTIPDVNLEHMEKFQIQDEDVPVTVANFFFFPGQNTERSIINRKIWKKEYKGETFINYDDHTASMENKWYTTCDPFPLEIAAPLKDFNVNNLKLENFELKSNPPKEDPIVLQPVMYEGVKHYLIVTAWGLEASDPLVFNEITN